MTLCHRGTKVPSLTFCHYGTRLLNILCATMAQGLPSLLSATVAQGSRSHFLPPWHKGTTILSTHFHSPSTNPKGCKPPPQSPPSYTPPENNPESALPKWLSLLLSHSYTKSPEPSQHSTPPYRFPPAAIPLPPLTETPASAPHNPSPVPAPLPSKKKGSPPKQQESVSDPPVLAIPAPDR